MQNSHKGINKPNNLVNETSPYLLQHAYNPVNWYAWNEKSLSKSKEENKPIFLSIGYSSCHWCHVMAHESFEDKEIAKIMNENFINIKVDREERPDLDDIYQRACQLFVGTGGWPLSVFLTPDQKPFYIGTYFPKESRYGFPGFATLLLNISQLYKEKNSEISKNVEQFMNALKNEINVKPVTQKTKLDREIMDGSAIGLLQMGDPVYGGFGQSLKFPNVSNLMYLLRYFYFTGNRQFLNFVTFTSIKMIEGGIHDHIGGGFSRYSTDRRWLVPHFEKMLYDNALLIKLFSELYQITHNQIFLKTVIKTVDYIKREMISPEGGFYSSQDADSEGEEGKYYLWSKTEIEEILKDNKKSEIFCNYFGITHGGNFEGKNILNISISAERISKNESISLDEINDILSTSLQLLLSHRLKRTLPGKDEKILISWNALMISGLISAYKVTNDEKILKLAIKCLDFIEKKLYDSVKKRLLRTYKDGIAKFNANLEDYSFYLNALLDTFEVSSNSIFLERALFYADIMISHFWDDTNKGFYFTSDDDEKLILRTKNYQDLSIPSGNSMAAMALLTLYRITGNENFIQLTEEILSNCSQFAYNNPFAYGNILICLYKYIEKPLDIVIIKNKKNSELVKLLNKYFLPNCYSSIISSKSDLIKLEKHPFFSGKFLKNDREIPSSEYAFVCSDLMCYPTIYSAVEFEEKLKGITGKKH